MQLLRTNKCFLFLMIIIFIHTHYILQEVNDIIKTKEDLHKLRKEYDDLKLDMIQVINSIDF